MTDMKAATAIIDETSFNAHALKEQKTTGL